jgi:hypothetical protein
LRGPQGRLRLGSRNRQPDLDPYLGQILLADLKAAHVQAMFTAITRQRAAQGQPVTAATLARVKATLRAALNAAIRAGYLTANPACGAKPPAVATMGTPLSDCQGALLAQAREPGTVFMMGDNPALPKMPERPTLRDFFRLRLSKIGATHLLQSARSRGRTGSARR